MAETLRGPRRREDGAERDSHKKKQSHTQIYGMPRPKSEGGAEPKKRSRTGCWPCKARKVKCGEEKPQCANCLKNGETCDYSIRLNWGGRSRKDGTPTDPGTFTFVSTPSAPSHAKSNSGHEHVFSAQHIAAAPPPPRPHSSHSNNLPTPEPTPGEAPMLDPRLLFFFLLACAFVLYLSSTCTVCRVYILPGAQRQTDPVDSQQCGLTDVRISTAPFPF